MIQVRNPLRFSTMQRESNGDPFLLLIFLFGTIFFWRQSFLFLKDVILSFWWKGEKYHNQGIYFYSFIFGRTLSRSQLALLCIYSVMFISYLPMNFLIQLFIFSPLLSHNICSHLLFSHFSCSSPLSYTLSLINNRCCNLTWRRDRSYQSWRSHYQNI